MEYDESQIGGYSITEIRGYLEKNQEEYLNRFRQIDRKKKFNGDAAFFSPSWFAYRMMWIEGFLLWFISSIITLLVSFIIYLTYKKEYECMIIICLIFIGCFLLFIVSLINNAKTYKYKGRVEGEIVSINKTISNGKNMKIGN